MKKAIFSLIGAALLVLSCEGTIKQKNMTVTLSTTAVDIPFGDKAELAFTVKDADGHFSVKAPGLPDGLSMAYTFDGSTGIGAVTLTSQLDKDAENTVTLDFSDDRVKVSKDLKVATHKKPIAEKELEVTLDAESLDLELGKAATVGFTAKEYTGKVEVHLADTEKDVTMEYTFDADKGTGTVALTPTDDRTLDKDVTLSFTNGGKSVVKAIKVTQTRQSKEITAPESIELKYDTDVIYPEAAGVPFVVDFTVRSESDFVVDFDMPEGIRAKLTKADDNRTGRLELFASEGMTESATITARAYNNAGEADERLTVKKAFITLDTGEYAAPYTGGTTTVKVTANVGYTFKVEENPGNMVSVSRNGDVHMVTVPETLEWNSRTAKVVFTDEKGYFKQTFTVVQEATKGTTETDRAALMNIYHALNGPNWPDEGGVNDILYSSWGCEDVHKWHGTEWYYSGSVKDRCWAIDIATYTDMRVGVMPDDLGHLPLLIKVRIGDSKISGLPDNLGNLTKMTSFAIYVNPLNIRLDTHEGLKGLVQNAPKLRDLMLCNCGLYGYVPEWLGDMYGGRTENDGGTTINLCCNYLSGQVPDKVAKCAGWNREDWIDLDRDGFYEIITTGEEIMRTQGGDGSYALWVGEKPDNVRFVDDSRGGHWEWIGPNPYRDNSRYTKTDDRDPDYGAGYYNNFGLY